MPLGDRPPEPLTRSEVLSLLDACRKRRLELSAVRNRAMLVVMWRAGLRCAEVLALRPADIDFYAGTVRVRFGKGRKARTVGIDDQALNEIGTWIEARSAAGITGDVLFCRVHRQPGETLTPRYVRAELQRLTVRAGLGKHARPHGLRHTMAVEWVQEGYPIPKLSRQLGHSNIQTTQIYADHLHPAEVIAVGRARSWEPDPAA